jgi:hypothetical protein
MKLAALLLAAAVLGVTALASPFIGVGMDWGWPYFEAGWSTLGFTGWVKKYEPNLGHWWALGVEGKVRLFFDNFYVGGGPRFSVFITENWALSDWHWGLSAVAEWVYKPVTVFFSIYSFIPMQTAEGAPIGPIQSTWPFDGSLRISFGFRYLLWCGLPGELPCPPSDK